MSVPDLNSEDGRASYRKELRQVALPLRLGGLSAIVIGAVVTSAAARGWLGVPPSAALFGYALLALGWALVLAAIFMRTRHHRRRLSEGL